MFQLEKGKYFQSELVNWEMAEEEQKDKRKTPLERGRRQQFQVLGNYFGNLKKKLYIPNWKLKLQNNKTEVTNRQN